VIQMQARGARRPRRGERLHETAVDIEVPFHDVDALRIVWHGHYYKYLELARTALLRARSLDAHQFAESPYRLIMIESGCRYVSPLRYGDRARVCAWFADTRYRLRIEYEITNLTRGRRAARAHTVLVTTDRGGRMLVRTPEGILARLRPAGEAS
jgi:acyl-CoA thioester hydrolase